MAVSVSPETHKDTALEEFYIHDDLKTHQHCATLSLARPGYGSPRGGLPAPTDPTGTVTFVRLGEKTYAITAAHVIKELDDQASLEGVLPTYLCPVGRSVSIQGPFITPTPSFPDKNLDVAICPIDARLPGRIGKTAYVLSERDDHDDSLTHAIALGFPTGLKYDRMRNGRMVLTMPSATAIAANQGPSYLYNATISFQSELTEPPTIKSLSGMSGGPVFWSKDETYGLLGFVKENLGAAAEGKGAVPDDGGQKNGGEPISENLMVHFTIEKAWHNRIVDWLSEVDEKHQGARERRFELLQSLDTRRRLTLEEFIRRDEERPRQGIVFEEWRQSRRHGEKLPRGRFFIGRYPGPEWAQR